MRRGKSHKNTSPLTSWLVSVVIALALTLVLLRSGWLPSQQTPSKHLLRSLTGMQQLQQDQLIDSIVAVIQSYYVDADRVDNARLLASTMTALSAEPGVSVRQQDGNYVVEVNGSQQTYAVRTSMDYEELLRELGQLANQLAARSDIDGEIATSESITAGAQLLFRSMLSSLDAHSGLLDTEAYRELRQGTEGSFGGLGVLVGIRDQLLTVIKPLPHSPAQRAGVRRRDRIVSINGVDTYGYNLDQLVEHMRGEPGTRVSVSILRENDLAPQQVALQREIINVDSVTSRHIQRGDYSVLWLGVETFSSRTSQEVLAAIKRARSDSHGKLHGLVLDLRSNPGGLLDQAVQVADLFLKSGVIVSTRGRRQEVESADRGYNEIDYPMVVLMNGDSASASEIVAGALQDHARALVVGQPSFGKGSVQTIFELPGDQALKLTIARYFTPIGRSIQNVGIMPDVLIQPVYTHDRNTNLLGSYRYKNERFLHNHLEDAKSFSGSDRGVFTPSLSGYYLAAERDQDDDLRSKDEELEVALTIIERVAKTYGEKVPDGMRRASHWLALAMPEVKAQMSRYNAAVAEWLHSNFSVTWGDNTRYARRDLDLRVVAPGSVEAYRGRKVKVGWEIKNNSKRPEDRISVFAHSQASGFETVEVLVGRIEAGETRSGEMTITIPSVSDLGRLDVRVAVAVDGQPHLDAAKNLVFAVSDRSMPVLNADWNLHEVGGAIPGSVEINERVSLVLDVRNDGNVEARDVKVSLRNLAGRQLSVPIEVQNITTIGAGKRRQVKFALTGSATIVSPKMSVGVLLESDDLLEPRRQNILLRAVPSAGGADVSNLIGH